MLTRRKCCCGPVDPEEPPESCDDCVDCESSYLVEWTGLIYTINVFCADTGVSYDYTFNFDIESVVERVSGAADCNYRSPGAPGTLVGNVRTTITDWTDCDGGAEGCDEDQVIDTPCEILLGCLSPETNEWSVTVVVYGPPFPVCSQVSAIFVPALGGGTINAQGSMSGACWPSFIPASYSVANSLNIVSYGSITIS